MHETRQDATESAADRRRYADFLQYEASLLDDFELEEWFSLTTGDVTIRVPVRISREAGSDRPKFSDESFYLNEGRESLGERVNKLNKEYSWEENPRSRIRHHISNVRVTDESDGEAEVVHNQLVFRSQGDTHEYELLSSKRVNVLRDTDDGLELADRTVLLDHKILPVKNLTLPML